MQFQIAWPQSVRKKEKWGEEVEYTGEATEELPSWLQENPFGLKASSLTGNRRGNEGCHGD